MRTIATNVFMNSVRCVGIAALVLWLVGTPLGVAAQAPMSPGGNPPRIGPPPGNVRGVRQAPRAENDAPTSPSVPFRTYMSQELENVPLLAKPFKEVLENQQQISNLRRQRQRISVETGRPSAEIMRTFHSLLEREDKLTSRQEELFAGITREQKTIRTQLQSRMATLMTELEEKRAAVRRGEAAASFGDVQNIERALRFYDYLLDSLPTMASSERRSQTMRRLLAGRWDQFGDVDPRFLESARRRLQQLESDLENVRRDTHRIEEQIAELRELVSRAGARGESADGNDGLIELRRDGNRRPDSARGGTNRPDAMEEPLEILMQPNP